MSMGDTMVEETPVEEIVIAGDAEAPPGVVDEDSAVLEPLTTTEDMGEEDADGEVAAEGAAPSEDSPELVSDFVAELLAPVSEDMPVGSDPHYGDRFYEIKREIDKLADNDYERVVELARAILREEGKDLRVAAYHLLAAVYVEGVQGLIDGLATYAGLLQQYGRYCFPTREGMRENAVRWLGNRKMQAYCEEKLAAADAAQLRWIRDRMADINRQLAELFGDHLHPLSGLDETAARHLQKAEQKSPPPAPQPTAAATVQEDASPSPAPVAQSPGAAETASTPDLPDNVVQPVSEQQLLRHARELIRYLADAGDHARAAAMARALLWGNLQLPPANGTATSVAGPRPSDLVEIRQLLADEEFASAFTLSEALLFGPGGRLALDLQCYAVQAAKGMKQRELVQIIENATHGLLQRLPKIVDLHFEDGTPFAGAETRRWLESLTADSGGAVASGLIDDERVQKVVKAAEKAAGKGKLAQGLAVFAAEKTGHPLTAFRLEMEMAAFCLAHQRADLAVPAFQKLMDRAHRESLASWNPELLADLARRYRDALRAMVEQVEDDRKPEYEQRMEELSAAMCQADLVQASRFL